MDFSPNLKGSPVGSVSAATVPRYVLYGEAGTRGDWFLNVERLERRGRERGWVIAPHTHPRFTQIALCVEGGGEFTLEGEMIPFEAPSAIVIPPYRIHGYRYFEGSRGWVMTIENSYLESLLVRAPTLRRIAGTPAVFGLGEGSAARIEAELARLGGELDQRREGSQIAAELHLQSVLLMLMRDRGEAQGGEDTAPALGSRHALVDRFREVVEARYREQPSLVEVAGLLGVSASQLRLACKEVTGASPISHVHDRILAEARRCLAYTGMSVSEIAEWLGFTDLPYFSRFFVRGTGQTPSAFRRRQQFGSDAPGAKAEIDAVP
ncbi:AraC family transcriptional regulator [Novosphingobium sp. 9]|uniref:AraC family transcriptional regulator n=1 Tax=Novosphingobium sp. 9 TaxID=2025349 RepID=UPI0021B5145F|nr:AraC family transcriptional regulator [Novosphingobium sp. 9]